MTYSDVKHLLRDAKDESPSIIVAVPRFGEMVYNNIHDVDEIKSLS